MKLNIYYILYNITGCAQREFRQNPGDVDFVLGPSELTGKFAMLGFSPGSSLVKPRPPMASGYVTLSYWTWP